MRVGLDPAAATVPPNQKQQLVHGVCPAMGAPPRFLLHKERLPLYPSRLKISYTYLAVGQLKDFLLTDSSSRASFTRSGPGSAASYWRRTSVALRAFSSGSIIGSLGHCRACTNRSYLLMLVLWSCGHTRDTMPHCSNQSARCSARLYTLLLVIVPQTKVPRLP